MCAYVQFSRVKHQHNRTDVVGVGEKQMFHLEEVGKKEKDGEGEREKEITHI